MAHTIAHEAAKVLDVELPTQVWSFINDNMEELRNLFMFYKDSCAQLLGVGLNQHVTFPAFCAVTMMMLDIPGAKRK
jgi:hypothetical protein